MALTTIPTPVLASNPAQALAALRHSMDRALATGAPANDHQADAPALTRGTARAVDMARLHLRGGNPGAYARSLAGEHRAANARQQRAIEAVIVSDGQERLFVRHSANGCLLAKEC